MTSNLKRIYIPTPEGWLVKVGQGIYLNEAQEAIKTKKKAFTYKTFDEAKKAFITWLKN